MRTTTTAWITAALLGLGSAALAEPLPRDQPGDDDAEPAEAVTTEVQPPAQHVLYFDFDSARLDVPARQELEVAIRWLREAPERRLVIEGHTDEVGSARYNQRLGLERARSARDYLVSRGVRPEQVTVRSGGEAEPISDDPAANRRAELETPDGQVVAMLSFRERERPVSAGPGPNRGTRTVSRVEQISTSETVVEVEGPPRLGIMIGGGVFEFADAETRVFAETGGAWTVRILILPRSVLSAEIAYVGSAQEIDALGLDSGAALVGTGVEAGLRLNAVGSGDINSYVFGGVGYTRFSLENADFNTSNVQDSDGVLIVPFGVGLSLPVTETVALDIRGLYRAAFGEELIPIEDPDGDENDLDSWSAVAQVAWLF
jgi:outer membrane protein OmpA-like peptidoglycan-associated protein